MASVAHRADRIHPELFPAEMRARPQWVGWKLKTHDDHGQPLPKPGKVPVSPCTGRNASTTDPRTWSTFEDAADLAATTDSLPGVGFVFSSSDPFVFVDLDDVLDPATNDLREEEIDFETGELVHGARWADDVVSRFASWTEISQSGRGLHVIGRGKLPADVRGGHRLLRLEDGREAKFEVYDQKRFAALTGAAWRYRGAATTTELFDVQEAVDWLLANSRSVAQNGNRPRDPNAPPPRPLDPGERSDFVRLWNMLGRTDVADEDREFRGPCPHHDSAGGTSLRIQPSKGVHYCEACGGGGLGTLRRWLGETPTPDVARRVGGTLSEVELVRKELLTQGSGSLSRSSFQTNPGLAVVERYRDLLRSRGMKYAQQCGKTAVFGVHGADFERLGIRAGCGRSDCLACAAWRLARWELWLGPRVADAPVLWAAELPGAADWPRRHRGLRRQDPAGDYVAAVGAGGALRVLASGELPGGLPVAPEDRLGELRRLLEFVDAGKSWAKSIRSSRAWSLARDKTEKESALELAYLGHTRDAPQALADAVAAVGAQARTFGAGPGGLVATDAGEVLARGVAVTINGADATAVDRALTGRWRPGERLEKRDVETAREEERAAREALGQAATPRRKWRGLGRASE